MAGNIKHTYIFVVAMVCFSLLSKYLVASNLSYPLLLIILGLFGFNSFMMFRREHEVI